MAMRRRNAGEWARLVAAFRASGLKQKEFAEREGISVGALQHWLYCPQGRSGEKRSSPGFVRVVGAHRPEGSVVVQVGDAVAVTFACAPEANYLASVVRGLVC